MNFDGKFMQDLRIEFGLQLKFLFIMGMGMSHKCNQYARLFIWEFLKMQQIVIIVLIMLMLEVILMG
jgi:hypothetical protein